MPLRKGLIAAARMGAKGVEIDARGELRPQNLTQTGLRDLRRLLDDHGLRVSAVAFHTRRGYDEPEEIERRVAATKAAMKFAADLRAPVVVNQVGNVPSESEGRNWNLLVQTLSDLSNYGQHAGTCSQPKPAPKAAPTWRGFWRHCRSAASASTSTPAT